MSKARTKVPTESDLRALPRWARVALAARTLRRVEPLALAACPKAPQKALRAVTSAIAEGELAAKSGEKTPHLRAAGMGALDAIDDDFEDLDSSAVTYFVPFGASRVSFGAQSRDVSDVHVAVHSAQQAVEEFIRYRKAPDHERAFLAAVWHDYEQLRQAAAREKWTHDTPVGPDFFGPMWPKAAPCPAGWPQGRKVSSVQRKRKTVVSKRLGLPDDLVEFLEAGRELEFDDEETECGPVSLNSPGALQVTTLAVTTEGTSVARKDPHRGEEGHYVVRVVDLIGECEAYDPEGILFWLCDDRLFGSWDSDHHLAWVFPKAAWKDIAKNPARYLNTQWSPGDRYARPLQPWTHGKFQRE